MCAWHGRGAIQICLSEKGALAKKNWETLGYTIRQTPIWFIPFRTFALIQGRSQEFCSGGASH